MPYTDYVIKAIEGTSTGTSSGPEMGSKVDSSPLSSCTVETNTLMVPDQGQMIRNGNLDCDNGGSYGITANFADVDIEGSGACRVQRLLSLHYVQYEGENATPTIIRLSFEPGEDESILRAALIKGPAFNHNGQMQDGISLMNTDEGIEVVACVAERINLELGSEDFQNITQWINKVVIPQCDSTLLGNDSIPPITPYVDFLQSGDLTE